MKKIAVFGKSNKKNEDRIAIHPDFFHKIPELVAKNLYFESGYGERFNISDDILSNIFGGVLNRDDLYTNCDVWLLPKPSVDDYKYFSPNKILWGWPHCVQGVDIAQCAIDNKMTLVAWEAMFGGKDNTHIFYRNNELAGYAAVQHMMMLTGLNGYFGKKLKAAVLGFGATARGAINSLKSLGFNDITVYSKRDSYLINAPVESVNYKKILIDNNKVFFENNDIFQHPSDVLSDYDIIVNCVQQDPVNPLMFIDDNDILAINKKTAIIDISCDEGMSFSFAKPTTFDSPIIKVNNNITYYCVDHTPSLYWDSASYEITKSILDFIPLFINDDWLDNDILKNALEIKDGKIVNKKIIEFQNRDSNYPYEIIKC
ncbi:N(5)-(carboxyethyl)ornithine synthase [Photobacterium carnosum]|uniref:N(5)-(carboxyethyl)ornithine synthase n=1 Tax=Photobacterium carnosum TaxID=2023717 RepID=UPI001E5E9A92|nr:N(5)-(carboxyethyl)ornithine synthase [Photobacterium carnosum]MCD9493512.1 alanine dehydrogenase [Photobacterium carnosum]